MRPLSYIILDRSLAAELRVEVHDLRLQIGEARRKSGIFRAQLLEKFVWEENVVRRHGLVQRFDDLQRCETRRGFADFETFLRCESLFLNEIDPLNLSLNDSKMA